MMHSLFHSLQVGLCPPSPQQSFITAAIMISDLAFHTCKRTCLVSEHSHCEIPWKHCTHAQDTMHKLSISTTEVDQLEGNDMLCFVTLQQLRLEPRQ